MKTKITTFFTIIMFFFIVSCNENKYLNVYPLSSISEGNFYNSELQLEQALNDVYRQLGRIYNAHGLPDLFGEQYSDNTFIEVKAGGDNFSEQINEYRILPDNGRIRTAWEACYNGIFICNNIIQKIQDSGFDLDNVVRDRMIAEALVVRSLIYYNMVQAWGGVPLVLEVISANESYEYLRTPPTDIYSQLINDLITAKGNLPENYAGNDIGRITKYGASAVLAKVYFSKGELESCKNELEFIIESGQFSLDSNNDGKIDINDYRYLFDEDTKNSKESILEIQYLAGTNAFNSNHQNVFAPFSHAFNLVELGVSNSIFRGEGINTPTSDLLNEFEENDLRKDISVFPGFRNQSTFEFVEYPFTIKFFDSNWQNPGNSFSIIRFADILLMYSWVMNDSKYLNMVRERAELPLFGENGYPNDLYPDLKMAIEHERRVELSFEFHRFFDLKNTNRAIEILREKGFEVSDKDLLFPIPQNEIDINPKLEQNPGY